MMMSLFSVFDPVSYWGVSLNWVIMVLVMLGFPLSFFFIGGFYEEGVLWLKGLMGDMYKEISFPNFKGLSIIGCVLFFYIWFVNSFGLFPYVFTVSGHLVFTFSVGLSLWMMSMVMGWIKMFKSSSAHLVPEGAPLSLAPFMVLIESVSHLIRPVTLSVRLAANMMAGHLIVGLIASVSMLSFSSFLVSVVFQSMMLVLEMAVCLIQAFVFSVLVVLYSLDFY